MKTSIQYNCEYCSRSYKLKENYRKHVVSCEFFHKIQIKTFDEFNSSVEKIPNLQEMFYLMKELAFKCNKLETELNHLKQTVNIRQKKQIIEWLNVYNSTNIPSYSEWVESITINCDNLFKVFEEDLIEGIKNVLCSKLDSMKKSPLCAFTQKTNTIYIYDEGIWRHMNNEDLEKMIYHLNKLFLKEFIKWQKENEEKISNSEKMKDIELSHMIKVNGYKISTEKMVGEIKKWLYSKIEQNLDSLYEFV